METIGVPRYLLKAHTVEGFIQLVNEFQQQTGNRKKAYLKAEEELEKYFKYRRYSCYLSFARAYYYQKGKKKTAGGSGG